MKKAYKGNKTTKYPTEKLLAYDNNIINSNELDQDFLLKTKTKVSILMRLHGIGIHVRVCNILFGYFLKKYYDTNMLS